MLLIIITCASADGFKKQSITQIKRGTSDIPAEPEKQIKHKNETLTGEVRKIEADTYFKKKVWERLGNCRIFLCNMGKFGFMWSISFFYFHFHSHSFIS